MMFRGRFTPLTSSLMTSCSVALRGAEYVMSRSMHSSTVYFGSPRVYRTNSSEKFSWTSVMGNRSLKTRSRPMSSRSCEAASSWSSASKARVWMSRRCGISIPLSLNFPNEISFINSGMSHPRTGKNGGSPVLAARIARGRGEPSCNVDCGAVQRNMMHFGAEVKVRVLERPGSGGRRVTPVRVAAGGRPLLHFDSSALLFPLPLDGGGLVLRDARLDGLRSAVDEVLRFLEPQAGQLAHDLDDLDLLRAGFLERHRELGLLLDRRSRRAASATSRRGRTAHWGGRDRHIETALESLDEVGELEDRHVADRLEDLVLTQSRVSHGSSLS